MMLLLAEDGRLRVAFNRVAYDVDRAAQAIKAAELPDEFAVVLRVEKV
jgi:hypothetical protein